MTMCEKYDAKTILYAEDDDLVRKLMSKNLERLGYRLILAADGQDAIDRFMEYRQEIKLLLLDMIMPRVNGIEAFEAIRRMQPEIKVIFCSACPDAIPRARENLNSDVTIIAKPVNMNLLTGRIREMLEETGANQRLFNAA